MSQYFPRTELAAQMAGQLLHPGVLDEGLRSGLFIAGQRRTGKTTFLQRDLIPALEQLGALVIYVDLWSDLKANPAQLVHQAVIQALRELQDPTSALLTEMITKLVDQSKRDVVLVVDEVQQAITTDEGNELLLALKAARDAVNPRPGTPGYFLFIGTGSHRALISELASRRSQAFSGATSVAYPVLGDEFVDHVLARLRESGAAPMPSREAAINAFQALGHRPEELLRALRQLQTADAPTDTALAIIAMTLRSTAADIELAKLEQLGALATAVFDRIAATTGEATGVFSSEGAAAYTKAVGREVKIEEIQPVVNELMAANLIMRRSHGHYAIADPFVQQAWQEKQSLLRIDGSVS
jgi:hypothetical protein